MSARKDGQAEPYVSPHRQTIRWRHIVQAEARVRRLSHAPAVLPPSFWDHTYPASLIPRNWFPIG